MDDHQREHYDRIVREMQKAVYSQGSELHHYEQQQTQRLFLSSLSNAADKLEDAYNLLEYSNQAIHHYQRLVQILLWLNGVIITLWLCHLWFNV
ncbi:hypothetical protein [Alterisphingorhabdus coralli]|uniref:Uncharacterized protein n=1 Tax=Alterisphingorhabdus coralli TaxID=3071408 RepID=A0AA97FA43_9SPHN|nr:hypothetical protein [Parasphingorhabdus sp. SCSIO 66989]WOE76726.1 hypothetical protein RB602_15180 [Parasphingorhabdus sp. SCSIO 66989]